MAISAYSADVASHHRLVELVQTMLDMHRQLSSAGPDNERTLLARRIEATDRQIDRQICRAVRTDRGGDRAGGGGEWIIESQEKLFLFIKQKRIEEKND